MRETSGSGRRELNAEFVIHNSFPKKKQKNNKVLEILHKDTQFYSLGDEVESCFAITTSGSAQHNDKCVGVFQHFHGISHI